MEKTDKLLGIQGSEEGLVFLKTHLVFIALLADTVLNLSTNHALTLSLSYYGYRKIVLQREAELVLLWAVTCRRTGPVPDWAGSVKFVL